MDAEEDFDESVKLPPKKKTKQGILHDSEDNDDDDDIGEGKNKNTKRKRKSKIGAIMIKKETKKSKENNAALSERRHDLRNMISKGTSHWLQNKEKGCLIMNGSFSVILLA